MTVSLITAIERDRKGEVLTIDEYEILNDYFYSQQTV